MDAAGRTKKVEDESFECLLTAAYTKGIDVKLPEGMDANPWRNQPTMSVRETTRRAQRHAEKGNGARTRGAAPYRRESRPPNGR
jgi:hypothetical protein